MGLIKLIRTNVRIVKVMNSCDRKQFIELIDEMIDRPDVFRRRRYIWNIIRGRDYYKMLSYYVSQCLLTGDDRQFEKAETMTQMVMETEPNPDVRKHFIWAIMKTVPILTITTIQYASDAKILSLLRSEKNLLVDDALQPFLVRIRELESECTNLRSICELEDV